MSGSKHLINNSNHINILNQSSGGQYPYQVNENVAESMHNSVMHSENGD